MKKSEEFFFYKQHPEFTILICNYEILEPYLAPWAPRLDNKPNRVRVFLKFHSTILRILYAAMGDRYLVISPEQWSHEKYDIDERELDPISYYYIDGSLNLLLNKMLQENNFATIFQFNFSIFKSQKSASSAFKKDFKKENQKYDYFIGENGKWLPLKRNRIVTYK